MAWQDYFLVSHTIFESVSKDTIIQGTMKSTMRLFLISLCFLQTTISAASMHHLQRTTEDYHDEEQYDLIDEEELSFHRDLLRCVSVGQSLYNAAVNLFTDSAVNCPNHQANSVKNYIRNRFDSIVNNDPKFKGRLRMQSNFCRDNRRLSETTETDDVGDENDPLAVDDIEMVGDSFMMESDKGDDLNRELWSVSTDSVLTMQIFVRGNGRCFFCWDDNRDFNSRKLDGGRSTEGERGEPGDNSSNPDNQEQRKLNVAMANHAVFYVESIEMEKLLNRELTDGLRSRYNNKNGHCLKGKDPAASVHIVTHKKQEHLTECWEQPSMHCCAPKDKPTDVCSKTVFDSWFCHETESFCTNDCNGQWIDSLNPPTNCLGEWSECTNGGTCCNGFTCHTINQWYSQCKP